MLELVEVKPLTVAPVLMDVASAVKVERGYAVVCAIIVIIAIFDSVRRKQLSTFALCVIGGFSIFWQELYADWATYLIWPDTFTMLPWGPSKWTTPNKPAFLMWAYPVFMPITFGLMLLACKVGSRFVKGVNPRWLHFWIAGVMLMLFNFINELVAVSKAGNFTYVDALGPAIKTLHGYQPLLYPNIPFGVWGGVLCVLILWKTPGGYSRIENLTRAHDHPKGTYRELARAAAWVLTWNLTFWLVFCTPMIIMREVWGRPNPLVP